jgi:hypothetical protein
MLRISKKRRGELRVFAQAYGFSAAGDRNPFALLDALGGLMLEARSNEEHCYLQRRFVEHYTKWLHRLAAAEPEKESDE